MFEPFISFDAGSNRFLLTGSSKTVLIDSGLDASPVYEKITELRLTLDSLINTHGHTDHVYANTNFVEKTGCRVLAAEPDAGFMRAGDGSFILNRHFGLPDLKFQVDQVLAEGDVIDLGGLHLEVFETPGHTQGSITLLCRELSALFTGDTVFADGIGRTDLPTGDANQLKSSLEKLMAIVEWEGIEKIYPGHGPPGDESCVARNLQMFF